MLFMLAKHHSHHDCQRLINRHKISVAWLSSVSAAVKKPKTAIVMMNMGGPENPQDTGMFLKRLFNDVDIIDLGGGLLQRLLGDFVSYRRTPKISEHYGIIGGSPIKKWTDLQGKEMCKILDEMRPESAPHKAYTCFRYASPLTTEAVEEMKKDGVERAIAFSQFPQWSCTTSGSSMNDLWRELKERNMLGAIKWSAIDRWNLHPGYIKSVRERIVERLLQFDEKVRSKVVIVFSAHSVPMRTVGKGDHYVLEVAESVGAIMADLSNECKAGRVPGLSTQGPTDHVNKHILAWQSKVGYTPWMVPATSTVIEDLGKKGVQQVLVVPVAFTSDHIETLFEIGIEYKEEAEKVGIKDFRFTEGLNGLPTFTRALADIVNEHLNEKKNYSAKYKTKCIGCVKPNCRQLINPAY